MIGRSRVRKIDRVNQSTNCGATRTRALEPRFDCLSYLSKKKRRFVSLWCSVPPNYFAFEARVVGRVGLIVTLASVA